MRSPTLPLEADKLEKESKPICLYVFCFNLNEGLRKVLCRFFVLGCSSIFFICIVKIRTRWHHKDSDKIMLARQTGLTRSRIPGWELRKLRRQAKAVLENRSLFESEGRCGVQIEAAGFA
ncbi:hypothetical protein L2E82_46723 [Cichorium intybus]|uniref:Uncharacterized protein n=1 Tax=Cichorium intybus TaxID=13427 RepID=A0ACB8YUC9_CICIN|nr:hypothetical protein L2E82_46723 [Cichorium intybus]